MKPIIVYVNTEPHGIQHFVGEPWPDETEVSTELLNNPVAWLIPIGEYVVFTFQNGAALYLKSKYDANTKSIRMTRVVSNYEPMRMVA